MNEYWPRAVDALLLSDLRTFGGVVLEGTRASGKTETGLQVARSSVRIDSEPALSELAQVSPKTVLDGAVPRLVDEWQIAPNLWNAARHIIDQRGTPGQFVFAGSAVPADDATRHSGAGRFGRLLMRTMSLSESKESTDQVSMVGLMDGDTPQGFGGLDVPGYARALSRGGWPALVVHKEMDSSRYLRSYLDDVARADLALAGSRSDPLRVRALMRALARNLSGERAVTGLAAEADISAQAARAYLDALERVFVVEELPVWSVHLRSAVRLRVQPKWHFVDPSLAVSALGGSPLRLLEEPSVLCLFFESLCIRDLRIYSQVLGGGVYHYRDSSGLEVDAIVELPGGTWAAFEVKLGGANAVDQACRNLRKLADKVTDQRRSDLASLNVLTAGTVSYKRDDGVNVVSLGHMCA